MNGITFDTLNYSKALIEAGMPQEQAEAFARAQKTAFDEVMSAKELATKGDIQDIRLEMKSMEMRLLKWQFGIALALALIMAKGFGWLGF